MRGMMTQWLVLSGLGVDNVLLSYIVNRAKWLAIPLNMK